MYEEPKNQSVAATSSSNRQLCFLGGLPRSGSTLLSNILMQNPDFHVTATSGLEALLQNTRLYWDQAQEFRAMPPAQSEQLKLQVLRHCIQGFFSDVDKPIIIDKSRGWTGVIPFIESVLNRRVKIIAPVRDVRAILASFEKLRLNNPLKSLRGESPNDTLAWSNLEGRCRRLFAEISPVGTPYRRIRDALRQGYGDRILFVDFDDLTHQPDASLEQIYAFLNLPAFAHDFDHVEQKTQENDDVFQIPGLHSIRHKVEPASSRWSDIIPPDVGKKFPGKELWEHQSA